MSNQHYLHAVTELGDTRKIVALCDIYSQSGIKLVASGTKITSGLYDRLVKHKLKVDPDKVLSVENMLGGEGLLADLLELIEGNDKLKKVAHFIDQGNSYRQIISDIRLPAALWFKLTVAREKFPRIYRHSLLMMVICIYLARCDKLSRAEEVCVALAALCHDFGLLHVDPMLLDPSHVMCDVERRHLYVHPMTAYLLLSEFPELPKSIADAVLEHHERMDGSGYPRSLRDGKISRYGQILAVSEVVTKAFDADMLSIPWSKPEVMLKLNSKKFGQNLIGHLNIFRDDVTDVPANVNEPERLNKQVRSIARLFENFNRHAAVLRGAQIFDFAQTRMSELMQSLFDAGLDPRDPDALIRMFMDDPECMAEYAPLLEETLWQLKTLAFEIARQWPEVLDKPGNESKKSKHAWFWEMKLALSEADSDEQPLS
ncbi:MAG: HD domain-containing phosphohydrolase [Gallionella sp.]|jgi:hypothetical protein